MDEEIITPEQIKKLDNLFDERERMSINTDEDYQKLGEIFLEDE